MVSRLRFFWLSLALAVSFVLCSLSSTAYALTEEEFDNGDLLFDYQSGYVVDGTLSTFLNLSFEGSDKLPLASFGTVTSSDTFSYSEKATVDFRDNFSLQTENGAVLIFAGNSATFGLNGLVNEANVVNSTGSLNQTRVVQAFDSFKVRAYDAAGSFTDLSNASVKWVNSDAGTLSLTVTTGLVDFDVMRLDVLMYYNFSDAYKWTQSIYETTTVNTYTKYVGIRDFYMTWSYDSESDEAVVGILEAIINLPTNLWNAFSDGLTGLFVPNEDSIAETQDKWTGLLADRFGALYQVGELITDYASAFKESEQDSIVVPEIVVPVGSEGFKFGGWEVTVVPQGMEILFSTLKLIVSIAATFLFVNGLRRRFEGLIGGAPSA